MKLNDNDKETFWSLAHTWASSTLDTPKRATTLLDFIEELRAEAYQAGLDAQRKPLAGYVDTMARDAEEALAAIEEQQAKRERRLATEQRREVDRRAAK